MSAFLAADIDERCTFFSVEVTSRCNLRCTYCYAERKAGDPAYPPERLVEALRRFDKPVVYFLGGEPLMNVEWIRAVVTHPGLQGREVTFALNTNGTLLRELEPELLARFARRLGVEARAKPLATRVITLEDRINGCFLRSMNGKPLPQTLIGLRTGVAGGVNARRLQIGQG